MDHAARHGRTASAPSCCYGKIPTLGDFIHRGLSRRQIDVWDQWLQGCVAAGRDALGERWLDFYLEAPVWYFAAAPGNLDQQTWMGVLIPSVDRVGRYFPFSILRKFEAGTPLGAMRSGQSWFGEAEQLAMDCLEDTFEPGDLDSRL
ncbi:MAG TPA: type VI secretion system-associated protein TagF, partial [Wenzhouxiangellaceae bacterium]|nr:type VI secretion system-associated protein TagF [Wenzhouxiangellaceae bacterium]